MDEQAEILAYLLIRNYATLLGSREYSENQGNIHHRLYVYGKEICTGHYDYYDYGFPKELGDSWLKQPPLLAHVKFQMLAERAKVDKAYYLEVFERAYKIIKRYISLMERFYYGSIIQHICTFASLSYFIFSFADSLFGILQVFKYIDNGDNEKSYKALKKLIIDLDNADNYPLFIDTVMQRRRKEINKEKFIKCLIDAFLTEEVQL